MEGLEEMEVVVEAGGVVEMVAQESQTQTVAVVEMVEMVGMAGMVTMVDESLWLLTTL